MLQTSLANRYLEQSVSAYCFGNRNIVHLLVHAIQVGDGEPDEDSKTEAQSLPEVPFAVSDDKCDKDATDAEVLQQQPLQVEEKSPKAEEEGDKAVEHSTTPPKRSFIAREILSTEEKYVSDLEVLCVTFVRPLMHSAQGLLRGSIAVQLQSPFGLDFSRAQGRRTSAFSRRKASRKSSPQWKSFSATTSSSYPLCASAWKGKMSANARVRMRAKVMLGLRVRLTVNARKVTTCGAAAMSTCSGTSFLRYALLRWIGRC